MATNGENRAKSLSELLLAGIGWASLNIETVDGLADDLAKRVGVDRATMQQALEDTLESWRNELSSAAGRRDEAVDRALARAGLVRRSELEDLDLRVAQLEHRLRLLERERA